MTAPEEVIPYGRQAIDEDDIAAVVAVLRGDWLTQGPAVEAFEQALAVQIGDVEAVAVSSGTAALHLAYLALDIGPGDAVIVPALTFAATANAVLYTGATPVFADVEPGTLGLSAESAATAIQAARKAGLRPKALAVVHFAGLPADLGALARLARDEGLVIVEDACHALGARYRLQAGGAWRHVGSGGVSACAVWSFHPVKHVTTGEGGAVTTADPHLARRLRLLRSHGITKDPATFLDRTLAIDPTTGAANPWYQEMQELGYNYRLSALQAALGCSQLGKLPDFVSRRRAIAGRYREAWADLPLVTLPPGDSATAWHSYHLFPLQIDFAALGRSRAQVMAALQAAGVGSQVHYLPVYAHPYYRQHSDRWLQVPCPISERVYESELSVPLYAGLRPDQVERVVRGVTEVLQPAH